MTFVSSESLNEKFTLVESGNTLHITDGEGGIPIIEIKNRYATASISLQGAQVLSWIPVGEEEVIWLSESARYAEGQSVRGGVPICWPWFGAHKSNENYPAHGFARTTIWQVLSTKALDDGATCIVFGISPTVNNAKMWPPETSVEYQLTIGTKLQMELLTQNNGIAPITISQAFHTYFKVADVTNVELHGLDGTNYLDKPDNFKRKHQTGTVSINTEVDRIYLDTASECVIEDKTLGRNIAIKKSGSHSTVVWNPWQEVAEKMGDLGDQGYRKMLCVESCNAADDEVIIQSGESHTLWVLYEAQRT